MSAAAEGTVSPSTLPRVRRVLPDSTPLCLKLELMDGVILTLKQDMKAVLLLSQWLINPEGELSVLSLWQHPDTPAYAVPDALLPELLPYFNE